MQNRNKTAAGLLALFLGGLGIHKFYLGQVGWGVLYLLFVWTGIPSIVGFIEGIIYLAVSENQFSEMVAPRSSGVSLKLLAFGLFGGLLAVAVVVYLIVNSLQSNVQSSYTLQDLQTRGNRLIGKNLRVSGLVLGDTIRFDAQTLILSFVLVNMPAEEENIEAALNDSNAARIEVIYIGPKPTLLQHGAQVTIEGKLENDGVFHADTLLVRWDTP